MKRTLAAVVAAASLLLIAPPAQASTPAWTQNDRTYVRAVRHKAPTLYSASAYQLISIAKKTCKVLRQGYDVDDVIDVGIDAGMDEDEVIAIVAGAIVFYCPDQDPTGTI